MAINIFDQGCLQKIFSDIESAQNQKRKKEEFDNSQIYNGEVTWYVSKRLQELFPETYSEFTNSGINIAKKVVDKLSVSYSEKPKRFLNSNDEESEFYNEILEKAGGNAVFQLYNDNAILHKYAAMQVFYEYDLDDELCIKLRALNPTQFDRVVDDFGRTEMVILSMPSENGKTMITGDNRQSIIQDSADDKQDRYYDVYTRENYIRVKVQGSGEHMKCFLMYDDSNPDAVNPIGVIPFVFFQRGDNTVTPVTSKLGQETITINEIMSIILTGGTLNCFGNLIIKHPAGQAIEDDIAQSLFGFLKLPQLDGEAKPTEADYINPQSNIEAFREALAAYAISVLDDYGITAGQSLKGDVEQFSSGIDRALASADTTKEVSKTQQAFHSNEQNLFEIIAAITSAAGEYNFTADKIAVIYKKEKPLISEAEQIRNIKDKIALGLITRAQALIELDPNMSIEKAKAQVIEVEQDKARTTTNFIEELNGQIQE